MTLSLSAEIAPVTSDRRTLGRRKLSRQAAWMLAAGLTCMGWNSSTFAADETAAAHFRERVQPILETYCYHCHGYGTSEGGRTLDGFETDAAITADRNLWWAVLKNVRAGVMPPAGEAKPSAEERQVLFKWIKHEAFGIDPANPDPGRATLRRLNRQEYSNTIRDLMRVEFDANEAFPADDAGYGFDNMGDVLSTSPLLMEKYLEAAEKIVAEAMPSKSPDANPWREKRKHSRFFPRKDPPSDPKERDAYARQVIAAFARRAYRRPADAETVERLAAIAKETYDLPGQTFEAGIARAFVAVLASPRFLFRAEDALAGSEEQGARSEKTAAEPGRTKTELVDEYALASRLSYLLWSSMPDDELSKLADRGELRANLPAQVARMVKDSRAEALARNFVGQWLRSRDVENFTTDLMFGSDLADLMRRETEMCFDYVVHDDRSVLELIDSNYTFLNARLAKHYGIEGVKGPRMQRVVLPEGSPRGGVLTQGTLLVVTSNPTRTSPVKRGLYILDNILGMPPPPPPPNIPLLENSAAAFTDHAPTVRELQEQHRRDPMCSSCHSRMDPLGLALENFSPLGEWRETDNGRPIDASGTLLTGEKFNNSRELKQVLKTERRLDFYRCLTQKLLTYALGRGLEYYDEDAVDLIVERLDREGGKFSALLNGIVESAPFQRQRVNEKLASSP